jgi:hypothetical protein
MLEVAASYQVAMCVWLAELCFSTAHSRESITIGGRYIQLHGWDSLFADNIASSLMQWRRETHLLEKTGLTSISDLKAGQLLELT